MYPNPVKTGEPVYFKNIPYETQITVLNYTGKVIFRDVTDANRYKMKTNSLDNGIYFIKMINTQKRNIFKLIIN
jgi:hypothetical protein